jgi:propionyl-CoA synthetase
MSRTDDIINVAGHRLSTGGMEEVLAGHKDVTECAVVGVKDALKGRGAGGTLVLKAGVNRPAAEVEQGCCALVREKTRSPPSSSPSRWRGCRRRAPARFCAAPSRDRGRDPWAMPATIDDPAILDEIGTALKGRGMGG